MPADLFTTFDRALLLVPHLQVQNANAISSPMTWGFPGITAFVGLMGALERKLGADSGLQFNGVGVVCHRFEAQTTTGKYERYFVLKKPSLVTAKELAKFLKDGTPPSIIEEAHIHLDISLVFDVSVSSQVADDAARQQLAQTVADLLATMRIAGGSVIAPHTPPSRRALQPQLRIEAEEPEQQQKEFAQLSRRLLPGFALVARDDLLQTHQRTLSQCQADGQPAPATALDAWLDLSRINTRAVRVPMAPATGNAPAPDAAEANADSNAKPAAAERIEWQRGARPGWLVPIPVGYTALSALHPAGSVAQARDATTPLRFVESVFSIGQWISPHRLRNAAQLIWWPTHDEATGLYRCRNACAPETFKGSTTALAAEPVPAGPSETTPALASA